MTNILKLLQLNVHLGHNKKNSNSKINKYLYGIRNNFHIFNIEKTLYSLTRIIKLLNKIIAKRGKILWIGLKQDNSNILQFKNINFYSTNKWFTGTLTNWKKNTTKSKIKGLIN